MDIEFENDQQGPKSLSAEFTSTQHALRSLIRAVDIEREPVLDDLLSTIDIAGNKTEKKFEEFIVSVFDKAGEYFKNKPITVRVLNTLLLFTDPQITFNTPFPLETTRAAKNSLAIIYDGMNPAEQVKLLTHLEALATGLKSWEGFPWMPEDYGWPLIISHQLRLRIHRTPPGTNKVLYEN